MLPGGGLTGRRYGLNTASRGGGAVEPARRPVGGGSMKSRSVGGKSKPGGDPNSKWLQEWERNEEARWLTKTVS